MFMEQIENIIKLYSEINMIYIELRKLEMANNRNSDMFTNLVNLLKKDLLKEKKFIDKIISQGELDLDDIYLMLDECTDRPFNIRFEDYINNKLDINISLVEELNQDIISDIKYSKLYDACSSNIFLMYLSFLQEYADSDSFNYLKDGLLNYKYYNSFINHSIESILIDSSFNVDRVNYINLDFIADMLKLNDSREVILECCIDTIRTTINQILSINDSDYRNDDKKVTSLNNQSMLRAGLVIISDSDYNNIKDSISKEYELLCNDNNKISAEIIKIIIGDRNKNKRRVRKISLRGIGE